LVFWLLRKAGLSEAGAPALLDQVFEPLEACQVCAEINEIGKLG
jgi:hypothetical protein